MWVCAEKERVGRERKTKKLGNRARQQVHGVANSGSQSKRGKAKKRSETSQDGLRNTIDGTDDARIEQAMGRTKAIFKISKAEDRRKGFLSPSSGSYHKYKLGPIKTRCDDQLIHVECVCEWSSPSTDWSRRIFARSSAGLSGKTNTYKKVSRYWNNEYHQETKIALSSPFPFQIPDRSLFGRARQKGWTSE